MGLTGVNAGISKAAFRSGSRGEMFSCLFQLLGAACIPHGRLSCPDPAVAGQVFVTWHHSDPLSFLPPCIRPLVIILGPLRASRIISPSPGQLTNNLLNAIRNPNLPRYLTYPQVPGGQGTDVFGEASSCHLLEQAASASPGNVLETQNPGPHPSF